MIIDWEADELHASRHDILDRDTGEKLDKIHIYYADDDAGFYRFFPTDAGGFLVRSPHDRDDLVREERQARIKIAARIPKP